MSAPKPEQLAEFYDVLGSQRLKVRDGYAVDGAAPAYQTSFDVTGTPAEIEEIDAAQTLDLRGLATVQWGAQVRQAADGLTAHLHWSQDGTSWHDFGEPDEPFTVGAIFADTVAIPPEAKPFARLGIVLEGGDGSTPVDASVVVIFR
jgi:hypothetical protein